MKWETKISKVWKGGLENGVLVWDLNWNTNRAAWYKIWWFTKGCFFPSFPVWTMHVWFSKTHFLAAVLTASIEWTCTNACTLDINIHASMHVCTCTHTHTHTHTHTQCAFTHTKRKHKHTFTHMHTLCHTQHTENTNTHRKEKIQTHILRKQTHKHRKHTCTHHAPTHTTHTHTTHTHTTHTHIQKKQPQTTHSHKLTIQRHQPCPDSQSQRLLPSAANADFLAPPLPFASSGPAVPPGSDAWPPPSPESGRRRPGTVAPGSACWSGHSTVRIQTCL